MQARHQLGDRHVPHAVVAGPVRTGDARPVEHERHPATVQRDVHQQLVEGPVEEGGVDRDHRVQAAHRQPGRGGHRVLLGDADVEAAVGERLGEPVQPGRIEHRGGDRHHPLVGAAQPQQLLGEHLGPGLPGRSPERLAGHRVDLADRVEAVLLVVLGRLEALALAGQAVHEHRAAELPRLLQRALHRGDVVTVDRPDVLQTQVGEHPLRSEHVLQPDLDPVQHVVRRVADQRRPAHAALDHVEDLLVARVGAQPGQVVPARRPSGCRSGRCR